MEVIDLNIDHKHALDFLIEYHLIHTIKHKIYKEKERIKKR